MELASQNRWNNKQYQKNIDFSLMFASQLPTKRKLCRRPWSPPTSASMGVSNPWQMSYWQSPEALPATPLLGAWSGWTKNWWDGSAYRKWWFQNHFLLLEVWHTTSCLMNLFQYWNDRSLIWDWFVSIGFYCAVSKRSQTLKRYGVRNSPSYTRDKPNTVFSWFGGLIS